MKPFFLIRFLFLCLLLLIQPIGPDILIVHKPRLWALDFIMKCIDRMVVRNSVIVVHLKTKRNILKTTSALHPSSTYSSLLLDLWFMSSLNYGRWNALMRILVILFIWDCSSLKHWDFWLALFILSYFWPWVIIH